MIRVECADHNVPMDRDEPRQQWACPEDGCDAMITDEELARLVAAVRDHPVLIVP